jgi:hypothetical protein
VPCRDPSPRWAHHTCATTNPPAASLAPACCSCESDDGAPAESHSTSTSLRCSRPPFRLPSFDLRRSEFLQHHRCRFLPGPVPHLPDRGSPERRRHVLDLDRGNIAEDVAMPVRRAALPASPGIKLRCFHQAQALVLDGQLHSRQTTTLQACQELPPALDVLLGAFHDA